MRTRLPLVLLISLLCVLHARAEEPWLEDFEEAARLAAEGNADEALPALGRAIRAGLDDPSLPLADPRMESIKRLPAFRRVMRSMAKTGRLLIAGPDEPGRRLVVRGRFLDPKGKPPAAAIVYVFQADASGQYTREDPMDEPNARIYGFLRTDESGRFELHTVHPGYYPEREDVEGPARFIPEHLHFEVTLYTGQIFRFQMVFEDSPRMSHPYWQQWAKNGDHVVAQVRTQGELEQAFFEKQLTKPIE